MRVTRRTKTIRRRDERRGLAGPPRRCGKAAAMRTTRPTIARRRRAAHRIAPCETRMPLPNQGQASPAATAYRGGRSDAARAEGEKQRQGRRRNRQRVMAACPGALPLLLHGGGPSVPGPAFSPDRPGRPVSAAASVCRREHRVQRQHLSLHLVHRQRCTQRGASATGPNTFTTGQCAVVDRRSRGGTSRWSEKFFHATTQRPSAPDDDRTRLWAESLPVYCDVRATCYPVMSGE
jgi:hypothetical protein